MTELKLTAIVSIRFGIENARLVYLVDLMSDGVGFGCMKTYILDCISFLTILLEYRWVYVIDLG